MSKIKETIDSIVKASVAPTLRAAGFKGSGRNFHAKGDGGLYRIVNVQASQSNIGDTGKFTINLGIFYPEFARLVGKRIGGEIPAEPECTIRRRIGEIMPGGQDLWWNIGPEISVEATQRDVRLALTDFGIPWLSQAWDVNMLAQDRLAQRPMVGGVVAFMNGDKEKARALLQQTYDENKLGRGNIVAAAERMGIDLVRAARPSHNSM